MLIKLPHIFQWRLIDIQALSFEETAENVGGI